MQLFKILVDLIGDRYNESDVTVMAKTIWAEARGECLLGQLAVGRVILNRLKSPKVWWGNTIAGICYKDWQFSCWNKNDPNRTKLDELAPDDKKLKPFIDMAKFLIVFQDTDFLKGCDHYINPRHAQPDWVKGKKPYIVIGKHEFFNNIS